MIARKEWFGRRKYTGWGVSPKTWQGWVYIACAVGILVGTQSILPNDDRTRSVVTIVWVVLLLIDVLPLMFSVKKDEREVQVEAISERNAAWFMVLVLTLGVLYDVIHATMTQNIAEVNWFVMAALLGGAVVKSVTNYILERE
ncbi:MAG: hypothetical protein PHY14_00680 [Candidatus Gracilibacteria bacterium]|nr:hypothetical protein [Candidatus Gracilibacteria bacterium]